MRDVCVVVNDQSDGHDQPEGGQGVDLQAPEVDGGEELRVNEEDDQNEDSNSFGLVIGLVQQ